MLEKMSVARQSKDLEWQEHEKAVDRIAASGLSNALGSVLTRLKHNSDAQAYPVALELLRKRLKGSRNMAYAVAKQALYEWLYDKCLKCAGRGAIRLENNVTLTCPECAGVQVRRFTDAERALSLGISLEIYRLKHGKKIGELVAEIESAVRLYSADLKYKLKSRVSVVDKPRDGVKMVYIYMDDSVYPKCPIGHRDRRGFRAKKNYAWEY